MYVSGGSAETQGDNLCLGRYGGRYHLKRIRKQSKIESAQGDSRRHVASLGESNRLPKSSISVLPLSGKTGRGK